MVNCNIISAIDHRFYCRLIAFAGVVNICRPQPVVMNMACELYAHALECETIHRSRLHRNTSGLPLHNLIKAAYWQEGYTPMYFADKINKRKSA